MIRIILIVAFISLGIDNFDDEEVSKYFYDDSFSKVYLELDHKQKKFTYTLYSCLGDWAEGNFEIKGNKLILETTSERNILDKGIFYFIENKDKLVYQYKHKFKTYKNTYELQKE